MHPVSSGTNSVRPPPISQLLLPLLPIRDELRMNSGSGGNPHSPTSEKSAAALSLSKSPFLLKSLLALTPLFSLAMPPIQKLIVYGTLFHPAFLILIMSHSQNILTLRRLLSNLGPSLALVTRLLHLPGTCPALYPLTIPKQYLLLFHRFPIHPLILLSIILILHPLFTFLP